MSDKACGVSNIEYQADSLPDVFQLIDTVAKKLTQLQRERIRVFALTPAQYSILNLLWEKDGRQLNELADACSCSPSTITGIVDTMEKRGLVVRELNPDDRRSFLVKLTEEGEALQQGTPTLEKVFNGCCADITREELQQLGRLLTRLNDTLTI